MDHLTTVVQTENISIKNKLEAEEKQSVLYKNEICGLKNIVNEHKSEQFNQLQHLQTYVSSQPYLNNVLFSSFMFTFFFALSHRFVTLLENKEIIHFFEYF